MWIFTQIGYFSVVKPENDYGKDVVLVRSRVRDDLERLRKYIPDMGPIIETPSRDYLWRTVVSQATFASALLTIAMDIDYTNFKDSVKKYDPDRSSMYIGVWSDMVKMQDKYHPNRSTYLTGRTSAHPNAPLKGQKKLPFKPDPVLEPLFNNFSVEPTEQGGYEVVDRSKKRRRGRAWKKGEK